MLPQVFFEILYFTEFLSPSSRFQSRLTFSTVWNDFLLLYAKNVCMTRKDEHALSLLALFDMNAKVSRK